jgi:hypothetical protein
MYGCDLAENGVFAMMSCMTSWTQFTTSPQQ